MTLLAQQPLQSAKTDPYRWLEDVQAPRSLDWVRARNAESQKVLEARPEFAPIQAEMLAQLDAKDRIAFPQRIGAHLYNFWQDQDHKRGLWRRTTLADFRRDEPVWETVLDLDALGAAEKENWVWKGASCLGPIYRRCLMNLSRGGADAAVVREFDVVDKRFVDDGFALPEAKTSVEWIDIDHLYVGTDFGAGSLTASGYPRVIKRWRRGTPIASASVVYEGEPTDVSVSIAVDATPRFERTLVHRSLDFFHQKTWLLRDGKLVPLDVPDDASIRFMRDTLLIELRSDLALGPTTFARGSLIAADAKAWMAGDRSATSLFTPTSARSLNGWTFTRDFVLLNVLDNVAGRLEELEKTGPTSFTRREVDAPFPGTLGVSSLYDAEVDPIADTVASPPGRMATSSTLANRYLFTYNDYLTPSTLAIGEAGTDRRESLKSSPTQFDATGMHAEQFFATSKDGTRVPYFVVWPKGLGAAKAADGGAPTLLYGYGGFEISMLPGYSGARGKAWIERGGVLVVANIRGGGEFGPAWHQAALKEKKQNSYDDFIAVAEDLIAKKITSARHLGIMGGSNGGLLVGAVMVQRPELFNAVVCQVPLLDMQRYHLLLAGNSWMGEYGNPDVPAEWAYISRYSPYQNVKAGVTYPNVFFATSTRDDRVHPGHARKMAAKMAAQGHPLLYYENIEGGHGGAADNGQRAHLLALSYAYLWQQLGQVTP